MRFGNRAPRGRLPGTGLLVVLLAAAGWRTFLHPLSETANARAEELAAIESAIAATKGTLARRISLEGEIATLESNASRIDAVGEAIALVQLEDVARHLGLNITRYEPREAIATPNHTERTVALGLSGSFIAIGRFFDTLAGLSSPLSIGDLDIRPAGNAMAGAELEASCLLTVFVFGSWPAAAADARPAAVAGFVPRFEAASGRDPFMAMPTVSPPDLALRRVRSRGLAGLSIADARVRGLVRGPNMALAVLEGPDGQSHVARVGSRLHDGSIAAITSLVVFRRDAGESTETEVRKAIETGGRSAGLLTGVGDAPLLSEEALP